jgi:putative ABC transport system permease protein
VISPLAGDFRYAARSLRRAPLSTAVSILTLGVGLGIFCTIFSILHSVLLRPLPFQEPERLVKVWETFSSEPTVRFPSSEVALVYLREKSRALCRVSGIEISRANVTDIHPEQITLGSVSPDLFPLLGVAAVRGRVFTPEEEQPGRDDVALIGSETWRSRFGSDPGVIGKPLFLDGERFLIVGVLPAGFRLPWRQASSNTAEVWIPKSVDRGQLAGTPWGRRGRYLEVVGELCPGVTLAKAQADLQGVARSFREQYGKFFPSESVWDLRADSLLHAETAKARPALLALLGAGILVLLITCANIGNLMLLRMQRREQEFAVRVAIGANRAHLVRQILAEGILLGCAGGALAILLATWGMRLLTSAAPVELPRFNEAHVDAVALVVLLAVSVLSGVASGLAAAFLLTRLDLPAVLKESGGRSSLGLGSRRLRSAFVVFEVMLATGVLVGAGLLVENYIRLESSPPGFDSRGVITLGLSLSPATYQDTEEIINFYRQLLEETRSLPDVQAAALTSHLPMSGATSSHGISVEGHPSPPGSMLPEVDVQTVSPDYFRALGIPLLRGRSCTESDRGDNLVVVVDRLLVERLGLGPSPLGTRLKRGRLEDAGPWMTIVGVVDHVKQLGLDSGEEREQIYYCYTQQVSPKMSLVLRTGSSWPAPLIAAIRERVEALNPGQPLSEARTQESRVRESLAKSRFSTFLLCTFASVALFLVIAGTYGVLAASASERRPEIAIRMALGAQRSAVLGLVVGQGLRLGLLGTGAGLLLALGWRPLLAGQLRMVSTTAPAAFAGAILLILGVVLASSWLPARRITRTDPAESLRGGR